jgi:hypothetical protein
MPWSKWAPRRLQRRRQTIVGFDAPRRNDPHCRRKAMQGHDSVRWTPATDGWEPDRLRQGDRFEGACPQQAPIFDDFRPFPSCPRACASEALVARTGRLVGGHLGRFLSKYRACCRSSVVEHSIGNGEVDSSILSGSTSFFRDRTRLFPAEVGVSAFAGSSGNRREIGLSRFQRQLFSPHLAALLAATTSAVQTIVSGMDRAPASRRSRARCL